MPSIIFFTANPNSVPRGNDLTFRSSSIRPGNVIYSLPVNAPVTFHDGTRQISKQLVDLSDLTVTSLQGTPGLVVIKARLEGELESLEQTINLIN